MCNNCCSFWKGESETQLKVIFLNFFINVFLKWLSGLKKKKKSTCQYRRCWRCKFDPRVGKTHWRRKWQPTPVLLPKKSHGKRNLVDYSPWGHKELDTAEWVSTHFVLIIHLFMWLCQVLGFPRLLSGKESACHCRRCLNPWVEKEMSIHSSILAWNIPWTE